MSFCPDCKTEYREGCKTCSDCNVELVDSIEIDKEEDIEESLETDIQNIDMYEKFKDQDFVLLKNVADGYEYNSVVSLLDANDIPLFEKQKGTGQYLQILMGGNSFGTDIYVPESKYEEALSLISKLVIGNDNKSEDGLYTDETKDDLEFSVNEFRKKKRFISFIIVCIFIIPFFVYVFMSILNLGISLFF